MARRAAVVDAYRQMAEIIGGVRVESEAVRLDGHKCNPVWSTADANRVLIENAATKFLDNTNVVFVR